MKPITRGEKHGFPCILFFIIFLFLFATSYIFAAHSPAMAQTSPAGQSNSKKAKGNQPEPKKVKPLYVNLGGKLPFSIQKDSKVDNAPKG